MSLTDDLLQALKLTLPDNNVNIVVAYPGSGGDGPSYVDLTISNGNFLNGLYDTYCIDANQTIVPGQSYQAQVYSSYNDPLPTGIIDKPENLDEINWLINQKFVGKQSSGGLGAYTSGDIQVAIWTLLENTVPSNILGTVGAYNQNRANQIVEAAFQNGGGFVPGISQDGIPQDIGIIVVPVNQTGTNIAQSTINILKTAALGDFVWEDLNANGVQDANEAGVEGVTVTLTGGGKDGVIGTADDTNVTTTTDANGSYLFPLLLPGVEYKVTFSNLPTGFVFTQSNQGNDTTDSDADPLTGQAQIIELNPNEFNRTIDAGIYRKASLGDFVFKDANNNGIQDAGEVGVGQVTVELINPTNGDVIATTTTNSSGGYQFSGLTPGNYQVRFTAPTGYIFSTANQGSNDELDSDANPSTGLTQTLTLTSGEFNGTLDAGLVPLASLGNFVFEDKNANGIQDAGETGIGNATVNLLDAAENIIATATTDDNGLYSFTNLRPGDYKVQFVQPNGFNGVSPQNVGGNDAIDSDGLVSDIVNLSPGENDTTVDAGFYKTASLGDFVFKDANNNGIQDAGEVGVGQVTVELINPTNGDVIATTTTNSSGGYQFSGLTPGNYQVRFTAPTGYIFSTANQGSNDELDSDANPSTGLTQTLTLASGEFNGTLDAGLVPLASLGNFVFEDKNANGIQDAGETGIGDATVKLLDTSGNVIATTTTDGNGLYSFTNLQPGDYKVQFIQPSGFDGISPKNVGGNDAIDSDGLISDVVNLSPGENDTTVDAGFYQTASLGDFVFNDVNNNGIQDAGEIGVGGVTVELINPANGDVIATTTTDANGGYGFSGLTPGEYQVKFTAPAGYNFSLANQGNNDALDSDANVSTGITQTLTLASGEFNGTLDAGLVPLASLGNFVFEDKNANGIQDAGETGIGDATVKLLDTSGNVIATTTTDGNGLYSFTNLRPGDYKVQFVQPNGFNGVSPQNVGGNDAIDSDGLISDVVNLSPGENDTTVDAGFYKTASLGDFVFNDVNNNGIQDAGEVGVAGVSVTLTGGGADGIINGIGDTTVTTTTNAGGNYNFAELTPGQQYQVGFSGLPAGFQFTQANVGANDVVDSDANPSTGKTQVVTLVSGENNLTLDAGIYQNAGDLSITKTDGLTNVTPGQQITYTIVARNNGLITATNALVSDIIPSNLTNVTWTSVASGGATDNQASGTGNINDHVTLTGGSSITYTVTGTVVSNAASTGSSTRFDFDGNSPLDGTDGNTRTFTQNGITVTARAFSRVDGTNGAWSAAYLGSYTGGLGVTDSSEGNGGNNTHVVDNVGGRDNYVLFQFSEAVVLDKAYLQYVLKDSDISVWIGNFNNPLTNLSDSTLNSFGFYEANVTTSSSDRWADVNAGNYVGNTIVIAALDTDTSPEDNFKLRYLDVLKAIPASLVNTATITAPNGFTDTNPNNNSATDTNTIVAPSGDLSITKTDGLTNVTPGQQITYTIVARNNGLITATNALVSDIIPSNLTNVTWTSVASGGATDNQASGTGNINDHVTLTGGSSITYTVTGTVVSNAASTGSSTRFDFDGNSPLDGTDGNTRTFTQNGITVTARAFSRVDGTNGAWSAAYLGSYTGGLGVTDSSEGNGGNNTHVVDNVGGRDNYVLFQFSEAVVLDKAYLQYVLKDSDISVWIGNFNNPLTNLSDSTLNSFGFYEANVTNSSSDRWADVNAGNYVGNTIVIAALDTDTSPEDNFKIRYLDVLKATPVSLVNTATITAPNGFTDTNPSNNSATDTNTVIAAPGVRTPDFWANTEWQKFWDGNQGNEPTQKTLTSDLLFAPYTNSAQSGKVLDPVTGQYHVGLLIGDFNRNGITDAGEDTLFYTLNQARQIVNSSAHPNADKRYDLGRSLVASWLNYVAGNPIDTANATDKDARYYIKEGINWLQALTPDENGDKKGDGAIHQMTGSSVTSPGFNDTWWSYGISSASSLPNAYKSNTNVSYGIDAGTTINSNLEHYNNGLGLADHVFSGGNA